MFQRLYKWIRRRIRCFVWTQFNADTEGLLVEVFSDRNGANFPADDANHDALIALDQFGLSLLIAVQNAADEVSPAVSLIYSLLQ